MNLNKNGKLTNLSKILRRNMTVDERHLWYDFLKNLPVRINRQKVIGPYIVDFYCASARLVIELDGPQHHQVDNAQKDLERDAYLKEKKITVLRYSNLAVRKNFPAVCEDILEQLNIVSKIPE